MKYYLRLGDAPPQAFSKAEIYHKIQAGTVTKETAACEVGAAQWSTLGQLVGQMFEPNAKPPEEDDGNAVAEVIGKAGHFIAEHGGEVASLAKLFTRRILASNFTVEHASPDERKELEAASIPVRSPMAQNYAAWRRAMLWFSGIGLALAAVVQFIDSLGTIFGGEFPFILRFLVAGIIAVQGAAAAAILLAARKWSEIRYSRRMSRWGWVAGFFGPLALFLLPLRHMGSDREWLDFVGSSQGPEFLEQVKQMTDSQVAEFMQRPEAMMMNTTLAGILALYALFLLVPRVFGLFPGIVRACMTLRTLVPESPFPGYFAALIAPLYGILLMVILGLVSQIGSPPLFFGLAALLCSPLLLLRNLRSLFQADVIRGDESAPEAAAD